MRVLTAYDPPVSPARIEARRPDRPSPASRVRIGVVQHAWHPDPEILQAELRDGIDLAAQAGARIVALPELTLSRYPADSVPATTPSEQAETLEEGPTVAFARAAAAAHGIYVGVSLFERADGADGPDGRGYNTAVLVGPTGELATRTRKMHIPVTEGYREDCYFRGGPADQGYPVVRLSDPELGIGLPTCWDEWFPEVARLYALGGADLLFYPTAIGSEPEFPAFDTQPLWQQVIVGHAIANGLFIAVPNRCGDEGVINFYGSSFIVDPYGRILVQAPRDEPAVLVADLDLRQRADWLRLFPLLRTRRPDSYAGLLAPSPAAGAP